MKVKDLIERLEMRDPEAEVLIAIQPNWPLQFHVAGVATSRDIADEDGDEDDSTEPVDYSRPCREHGEPYCQQCPEIDEQHEVVYIVEGGHPDHPYAPRGVWDEAH